MLALPRAGTIVFGSALVALLAAALNGQCATPWVASPAGSGTGGTAAPPYDCTVWDPDGAGPASPVVVIAGHVPGVSSTNIAVWNPVTDEFSGLGTGMNGSVLCVATLPNGDLVAGGDFTDAGGVLVNRVARWDGTSWSSFGSGFNNGLVRAFAVLPSGELVAGGSFTLPVGPIARWSGGTWLPLGSGTGGFVTALRTTSSGTLLAGGFFGSLGGIRAWNGSAWSNLGSGIPGIVTAIGQSANGDIVAGGNFATAGAAPANNIARWNGTSWSALGAGTNGTVNDLVVTAAGDLFVAGSFATAGGMPAASVARWNGSAWSALGMACPGTDRTRWP